MTVRASRGYLMIELLFALGLLAVFAAIATPVLRGAIRTLVAPPPAAAAARADAAVDALRRDVWAAATLAAASPHELTVTDPAGHAVVWHVGPGRRLDRADGGATTNWSGRFAGAGLTVDGPTVRLAVPGGTVVLVSQVGLIGGLR